MNAKVAHPKRQLREWAQYVKIKEKVGTLMKDTVNDIENNVLG